MNNIVNYKDLMAFHPGYYVAEIIEDMEITQREFAMRMGTTPKTLSNLVNGQINLSNDLAKKLSNMLGSSVDFWLNLQKNYDKKIIEIQQQKELDEQADIASLIDYSFFEKLCKFPHTTVVAEKVRNLCEYFMISDLRTLARPDFLVNFRTGISSTESKNIVNAQAWLQTALNISKAIETQPFNADLLKKSLPEIRSMTLQNPETFLPRLQNIFTSCGVAFVLLPHLKNSGVNGAVKWVNPERVVLAMNDRRAYADTFWFSLFHEIKHVLQQKVTTVFLSATLEEKNNVNSILEEEADSFAQDYLIPPAEYKYFSPTQYTSDSEIIIFAHKIGIHPGVVAGRMQHDGIIPPNRCSKLKQKYKIIT